MTDEDPARPTFHGRPVNDEEMQRLADEAEAGYQPARLRRISREPGPGRTDPAAGRNAPTTDQADAGAS